MSSTPPKPNMPRWVKVLGIVFIMLIVVVVALHITGNGLGVYTTCLNIEL
jgi:hypothetical protein